MFWKNTFILKTSQILIIVRFIPNTFCLHGSKPFFIITESAQENSGNLVPSNSSDVSTASPNPVIDNDGK
jgi:hypothetical protein